MYSGYHICKLRLKEEGTCFNAIEKFRRYISVSRHSQHGASLQPESRLGVALTLVIGVFLACRNADLR